MKFIIENIDLINGKEEEFVSVVAPYYSKRYKKLSKIGQKTKNTSERQLLAAREELLSGYLLYKNLGVTADEQLSRNVNGKPFLLENKNSIYFNLSHSTGTVALVISDEPVGIDIERPDRMKWSVISRIATEGDKKRYEKLEEELQNLEEMLKTLEITKNTSEIIKIKTRITEIKTSYARLWTSYEAMLKHVGTGFAAALDDKTRAALEQRLRFVYTDGYVVAIV